VKLTRANSTTDLCDLIRFIEEPDRGTDWNGEKGEWVIGLSSIPNWTMVVEKRENWDDIEKARPHKGHGNLCEIFLTVGGLELAKRWLHSDVDAQRKAAENWLLDKVGYLDRLDDELDDKINSLDKMIPHFEEACQVALLQKQHRIPYNPNGDERELIARLMEITRQSGYLPAALPPILSSSETPPLFVAYPELDEENENREDQIPRNERRWAPEILSIEDLLGVYQPRLQQIIIYERGIKWMVRGIGSYFDEEWLSAVVLIHEIGHWITHQLPQPGVPTWPTDLYVLGETEVHEGWAQLITWWIADQVDGKFKHTFEELNRRQSPPYHVFEQFKTEPIDKVMASLEKLRLLQWPARLEDWKKAL
jgi:hypothetical protein